MSARPAAGYLLAANEVHVWSLAAREASGARDFMSVLDAPERARAAQFRFAHDLRIYAGAHWLLRTALSHYGPMPPQAWRFRMEAEGRPLLADDTPADLHFSLSHAAGGALVAIGRMPAIGIDIEGAGSLMRMREIAPRFMHPHELEAWRARRDADADGFALTLWTLKEAYAKALGRGLALDFRRVRFCESPEGWRLADALENHSEARDWHCVTFAPCADARAALVVGLPLGQSLNCHLLPAPA